MQRGWPLRLWAIAWVLVAAGLAPGTAQAQDNAPYFKGKTIHFLISVGVAGGFAEYGRTLIAHMPRHIPGEPHMILQSMPGAGGMLATNYLYNQAPQDGTMIGMINATVPLAPLMGSKAARFDVRKFNWLGSMDHADGVCTFWHTAGINTFDDLLKKTPTVGSNGSGSPMEVYALAFNRLFGARIKVVGGYKAGSDVDLAMVRGEIDGRCGTHLNTIRSLHPDWVGPPPKFTVPAIVAAKRRPDYPDTPTVLEFVKDDFTRARLQLLMVPQTLNRPVLAPPNVPAERVKELRAAFDATMTDPAFLAEIAKKHLEVNPSDAAEVTKVIGEAYAMPPKVIAGFRELITP